MQAMSGALSELARAATVEHHLRPGTLQLAALPPLALYVHLPWCLAKCPYCDFNSHEVALVADCPRRVTWRPCVPTSRRRCRWCGAGRSSACSSAAARRACFRPTASTRCCRACAACCRWSRPARSRSRPTPAPSSASAFAPSRRPASTRLSIGVQSFDDTLLTRIGRVHDAAQARAAVAGGARGVRDLQPRPDVRAAGPEPAAAAARPRRRAGVRAAAPVGVPPDDRAEHALCAEPAAAARRRPGQRHARCDRRAHGDARASHATKCLPSRGPAALRCTT